LIFPGMLGRVTQRRGSWAGRYQTDPHPSARQATIV
jgi:hypothetical protein